jgi:cardiolipin synthase A/B
VLQWSLLYLLSEWVIRLIMLVYVPQKRSPAAARTWLLLIFLLPWPGLILYALFGRIYLSQRRVQMQERASRHIQAAQGQMAMTQTAPPELPPRLKHASILAARLGDFQALGGNRVEWLTDYTGYVERLIAEIDGARRHAHLLYYIFEDDGIGRRVADALVRAARRGVACRVLMDGVGSQRGLKGLAPSLREYGVDVRAALPVGLFRRNSGRFDLRNHRKIAVVDGRVAFTGSQNLVAPEFVKNYPNEELNVRVTGPVVAQLQAVFLADYYFETGRVLDVEPLFPRLEATGHSLTQLVPSGPGHGQENGQELIVTLLYAARERIVIGTPYFVPDQPVLQALQSATRRGVAVRLILPKHSNRLVTQLAQRSYYDELLEAGVHIHLYEPRFLHAKHLTIDDQVALIGSTNMDIRSFALNFEVNLLIYDPQAIAEIQALQRCYFTYSERLSLETWKRRSLGIKVLQNTARLADSLL